MRGANLTLVNWADFIGSSVSLVPNLETQAVTKVLPLRMVLERSRRWILHTSGYSSPR